MLLRRGAHERTWSLPGGRIGSGQAAAEALRRERYEDLAIGRPLWVVEALSAAP